MEKHTGVPVCMLLNGNYRHGQLVKNSFLSLESSAVLASMGMSAKGMETKLVVGEELSL
jgi:hypothetical protein